MNTHLSLINGQPSITNKTYNSMDEIVESLKRASKLPHEEYDSVKLYGNSEFIISVLKYIIQSKKCKDIVIASIDITSSKIDPECENDYVLSLYNNELYIQSVWNGTNLFANEAKFTMCHSSVPDYIIDNAIESCSMIEIFNFLDNKNKFMY